MQAPAETRSTGGGVDAGSRRHSFDWGWSRCRLSPTLVRLGVESMQAPGDPRSDWLEAKTTSRVSLKRGAVVRPERRIYTRIVSSAHRDPSPTAPLPAQGDTLGDTSFVLLSFGNRQLTTATTAPIALTLIPHPIPSAGS